MESEKQVINENYRQFVLYQRMISDMSGLGGILSPSLLHGDPFSRRQNFGLVKIECIFADDKFKLDEMFTCIVKVRKHCEKREITLVACRIRSHDVLKVFFHITVKIQEFMTWYFANGELKKMIRIIMIDMSQSINLV